MPVTRARTLAMFGSVRIREFVAGRDDARSRLDRVPGLIGLHSVRSGSIDIGSPSGTVRLAENDAFLLNHDATVLTSPLKRLRLLSIVLPAEVLAGLMVEDRHSFLSQWPKWKPTLPAKTAGTFTMADLINFTNQSA